MRQVCLTFFLLFSGMAAAGVKPVLSMMTTCAQLTPNFYPADTTTWFDAQRNPQVVFFAHMLFPLRPDQDGLAAPEAPEAWHPPLVAPKALTPEAATLAVGDAYYAEAQWLDPDGLEVAYYGLTMPARVSTDYVRLGTRQYIPHTFAMSLGTKDLRTQAGQKQILSKNGQYHIRLYVSGQLEGIAFFRMLGTAPSPSLTPGPIGEALAPKTLPAQSLPGSNENLIQDMLKVLTQTAK